MNNSDLVNEFKIISGCCINANHTRSDGYTFSSDILSLDKDNRIGIEYCPEYSRIRIEKVEASDKDSLISMLDALVEYANELGYENIWFFGHIEPDLLGMLIDCGFEASVLIDPEDYNIKLTLKIKEDKAYEEKA